jgi:cytochrome c-type biogenesis protein CcmH
MRKAWLAWLLVAAVLLLALALAGEADAQSTTPLPSDDQVNAVAKELYCPVCENVPLDVCPTTACAQWRAVIRDKLAAGWSEQQIRDYFAAQYGDRVLDEPPSPWAYIIPVAGVLLATFFVIRLLRSMRQRAQAGPALPAEPAVKDEYQQRIEEDLRRRQ